MLILGIDGARHGCGWTLGRAVERKVPKRRGVQRPSYRFEPIDFGRFVPHGEYSHLGRKESSEEARLLSAMQQLEVVIDSHRRLEEPIRVVIEEPPPTTRNQGSGRAKRQAPIGRGVGGVIGAVCLYAVERAERGYLYPWRVEVSRWRRGMGVTGQGMGGSWKAAACLAVLKRYPKLWPTIATYSSRFTGNVLEDHRKLVTASFVEKLDKDNAAEVAESFLIAEYGATHHHLAPPGPKRAVRIGIGGGHELQRITP